MGCSPDSRPGGSRFFTSITVRYDWVVSYRLTLNIAKTVLVPKSETINYRSRKASPSRDRIKGLSGRLLLMRSTFQNGQGNSYFCLAVERHLARKTELVPYKSSKCPL